MSKSRFAAIALTLAAILCKPIQAQQFTLGNLSIGMSEQEAMNAIGHDLKIISQPVTGLPIKFVYAANDTTGYSLGFIDGKLESYSFNKHFPSGSEPLIQTVRNSISSKLWAPMPGNTADVWMSDRDGTPLQNDAKDFRIQACSEAAPWESPAFSRLPVVSPATEGMLKGVNTHPRLVATDPRCGIAIAVSFTRTVNNAALALYSNLTVTNLSAYSAVARRQLNAQQNQKDQQTHKAGAIASPY